MPTTRREDVAPNGANRTAVDKPYKAIVVTVIGALVTVLAAFGISVPGELAAAVATVVAAVLVYVVPNKPAGVS